MLEASTKNARNVPFNSPGSSDSRIRFDKSAFGATLNFLDGDGDIVDMTKNAEPFSEANLVGEPRGCMYPLGRTMIHGNAYGLLVLFFSVVDGSFSKQILRTA